METEMTETIIREISSRGVARITLNRPQIHNALDDQVIDELYTHFVNFGKDPDIRAIILAARGKLFCAGADINWVERVTSYTPEQNFADAKKQALLLEAIDTCPKPTIALVQGPVYATGVGLVAACDIAIAVEDAYFCFPEVKRGLIPAVSAPYVVNAIGQRQARRFILTSERMTTTEALRLGLIHLVVGEGELDATSEALVDDILKGSPESLRAAKELIRFVESRPIDEMVHNETARRISIMRASKDGQEGIQAFLANRRPSWVGNEEG